jgi:hypothetical protein
LSNTAQIPNIAHRGQIDQFRRDADVIAETLEKLIGMFD